MGELHTVDGGLPYQVGRPNVSKVTSRKVRCILKTLHCVVRTFRARTR
jgi:hypothetical protein